MATKAVLRHLAKVELDGLRAYDQAIESLEDGALRQMLRGFRGDHARHLADLSQAIEQLGASVPQHSHLEGFAVAGYTRFTAGLGEEAVLMAMESTEVVTTQAYAMAVSSSLPAPFDALVAANQADEERHLAACRAMLERDHPLIGGFLSSAALGQGFGLSLWLNLLRSRPPLALPSLFRSLSGQTPS